MRLKDLNCIFKRKVVLCLTVLLFLKAGFVFGVSGDSLSLNARSAILIDAATGDVLYAKNVSELIPPASLTKLMTIHIAQELAEIQGVLLDDPVPLPAESWAINQPPRSSLMFLAQGQIVSLRELFLGLAIPSGNDAAVAVALRFAPSVAQFVELMNGEAARLGLKNTRFVEPSGIDENNLTTAADFAQFCREYIRLHPENINLYHTIPEFAYPKAENVTGAMKNRPRTIVQNNHITILKTYPGADGLKTGYIDESGYNIAATAERNGTRFIAVVLGIPAELGPQRGDRARTEDVHALFDYGFLNYKTIQMEMPELTPAKVWKGRENRVLVTPAHPLAWTIPVGRGENLVLEAHYTKGLTAPVAEGDPVGVLVLSDSAGELAEMDLLSAAKVERAGIIKRFFHSVAMFLRGIK